MKLLALSVITVMALFMFACGEEAAPEPTPTSTPDTAATAAANAQPTAEA
ncbi:MAG: ABC transporter substrate-binding protein, partial [Chloroflexi bacterium]|nr:ABC transporter substrate-binding protein [Chloroflexota bacterium]